MIKNEKYITLESSVLGKPLKVILVVSFEVNPKTNKNEI